MLRHSARECTNASLPRRSGHELPVEPTILTRSSRLCIISQLNESPSFFRPSNTVCSGTGERRYIVTLQNQVRLLRQTPRPERRIVCLALLLAISLASTGCGEKKQTQVKVPPPPPIAVPVAPSPKPAEPVAQPAAPAVPLPKPAKPAPWTQTGIASWYVGEPGGPKTASGEPYDGKELTAAHKTLPFHSIVRVTHLKTKRQVVVRINDRGPFIDGRVIDLSLAAAKALDIQEPGLGQVKLEVLHTPKTIDIGGKWCVQIGEFHHKTVALDMQHSLSARYSQTHVEEFAGGTGYWVRVLVQNDDRLLAQKLAGSIKASEGGVYLVRLD